MVETMIRLKPVADRTPSTVHFLSGGQSLGFLQTDGAGNLTRNGYSNTDANVVTASTSFSISIFSV